MYILAMSDYIPISCSLHDELESVATLRKVCEILYWEAGKTHKIVGVIVDLYARDRVEYLRLDNGLEIRLDGVTALNGKAFGDER